MPITEGSPAGSSLPPHAADHFSMEAGQGVSPLSQWSAAWGGEEELVGFLLQLACDYDRAECHTANGEWTGQFWGTSVAPSFVFASTEI